MAILANGTQLHKLDKDGTTYLSTYRDVTTIGELGGERGDIEYDTLDLKAKESRPGKISNGELSLEMLASVNNYSDLEKDFNDGKINLYAITFPIGSTESNMDKEFEGYVKSCKITGIEPDGLLKVTASIKISGELKPFSKPVELP